MDEKRAETQEREAPTPPAPVLPGGDYLFANVVAFVSGACLMNLELVASRVLAPVFGNTIFLWTSVIGLILAALSLGYWLGGSLADRRPRLDALCGAVALAGLFVAFVPLLSGPVLRLVGRDHGLVRGPLLAATALFLAPSVLLGSLSPMAVKLVTLRGMAVGRAAGRISALGALGSIAGTFCGGFLLIPIAGSRANLLGLAVTLWVVAGGGFVLSRRFSGAITSLVLSLAIGLVAAAKGGAEANGGLRYDRETFYHRLRVRDQPWGPRLARVLWLDTTIEGAMYLDGQGLPITYTRYVDVVDVFVGRPRRAAFIGGGSYAMPKRFLDRHPHAVAEVYELDREVVKVGQRFFETEAYPGLINRVGDARRLLGDAEPRFDLIVGDAYNGVLRIPFHLTTLEYYRMVRGRLRVGGVYMTNIISEIEGPGAAFFLATARTLRKVFPEMHVFAPQRAQGGTSNLVIVCPVSPRGFTAEDVREMGRRAGLAALTDAVLPPSVYERNLSSGLVLTDDHSPVEALIHVDAELF